MSKKYTIEDLIKLIDENKSTDYIGKIYWVSGRCVRHWFKNENL